MDFDEELAQAERGSPVAQVGVGIALLFYEPPPRVDPALGHRMLHLARARGVPAATTALGLAYLEGRGVDPDPYIASELLEQSGSWPVLIDLGKLYATGMGEFPVDVDRAIATFERAVATADARGFGDSEELGEAKEWLVRLGRV